jgi:flagellar biosynthesis/type III secretory pathway chaperone
MQHPHSPASSAVAAVEPGAMRPATISSAPLDACLRAMERLDQVLDQETDALRRHRRSDLGDFNRRKSHGLLELTRAVRALDPGALPALGPQLRAMQAKLQDNGAVLRMNLQAVQEISSLVARTIREHESDGTYSSTGRFPGERR